MGIDFGSDSFKLSLIKGNTFEVVINKESSRKTLNAVGFTKSLQRVFGNRAGSLMVRSDDRVFKFLANLLGRKFGNPLIKSKSNFYPYNLVEMESRGTYGISISNKTSEIIFSTEELVAMLLEHAKEAAENFSDSSIKDCVITVPPYWTHHERKALINSAKLAGLNVLSVINEQTAVALHYSISRKFEGTENVLFYDLGESSAKATVVSFSKYLDEKNKTVPQLQVLSTKWDTSVGARDFEYNLVQHFANLINKDKKSHEYTSGDIRKHRGAMGKLMKETRRIKEVLSANTDTLVSVEGLIGEYDFRTQVDRETFEKINSHLWPKLRELAQSALSAADVEPKDLVAFELVGGGIRMPKAYETLREFYGRDSLDRHLNGDEAACQGAAYYAVTKSIAFKTQNIQLRDINLFPVSVRILDDSAKENKKIFFSEHSKFDDKRFLTFRTYNNTLIQFDYEPSQNIPKETPLPLLLFNITGMPTHGEYNFTTTPKVSVTVFYKNGVISVEKAEVRFRHETVQKITKKIKKDEKKMKEEREEREKQEQKEQQEKQEKGETSEETTKAPEDLPKEKPFEEVVVYEPVNKTKTITLTVTEISLGIEDFSSQQMDVMRKRYNKINKVETNRIRREKALNDLESFIYNNKEVINEQRFVDASTNVERESIQTNFDSNLEWLEEEGSSATLKDLEKRLRDIKKEIEKVEFRISESTAFPSALKTCRINCNFTRTLMENITQRLEVTEEEYNQTINDLVELEEWLETKEKEQSQVQLYEDPKVTSSTINSRCSVFSSLTKRLLSRRKRVPKKPKVETPKNTTIETNSTQTETNENTNQSETPNNETPSESKDKKEEIGRASCRERV